MLSVTYINGFDDNVVKMLNKFVDGSKVNGAVKSDEDYLRLQLDLDKLEKMNWTK